MVTLVCLQTYTFHQKPSLIFISSRGDTESEECQYKFRMDLRFLCQSLKISPDHGSGEFARNLTASKYYSDKKKLVLNGLIQLDGILSNYNEDSQDVKIPLFQALGKCLCLHAYKTTMFALINSKT